MAPNSSPDRALQAILPLIASGQAYEAHQKARTFASRYVKASAYDTAIEVLFQSARELLKGGHAGSGTDLGTFLIDVYNTKEQEVDEISRGRLTQLIALTGSEGTWRKTLIDRSIAWSSDFGESEAGDPALHYYIGELLFKEDAFEPAETHLLAAGTRDSARLLATLMFKWLDVGDAVASFATRGVLPFLLLQNILAARTFLSDFLSQLIRARPTILIQPTPIVFGLDNSDDEVYVTTDPTLNFLQLAIRTCQRAGGASADQQRLARNAWVRLYGKYHGKGGVVGSAVMNQAAANIGELYFDITPPRQATNPLQSMMASLFGGDASAGPTRGAIRGRGRGRSAAPGLD